MHPHDCSPCEIRGFPLVHLPGLSLPQESCRPNRTQALWTSPASQLKYSGWRPRSQSLHPRKRQDTCSRLKPGKSTLILSPFPLWAPCGCMGCCLYEPSRQGWRGCWCYICILLYYICKFTFVNKVTFVYVIAGLVFLKLRLSNTAVIFTEFLYLSDWLSVDYPLFLPPQNGGI